MCMSTQGSQSLALGLVLSAASQLVAQLRQRKHSYMCPLKARKASPWGLALSTAPQLVSRYV